MHVLHQSISTSSTNVGQYSIKPNVGFQLYDVGFKLYVVGFGFQLANTIYSLPPVVFEYMLPIADIPILITTATNPLAPTWVLQVLPR